MHLDLVGGYTLWTRKADDKAARRSRMFVGESRCSTRRRHSSTIASGAISEADLLGFYDLAGLASLNDFIFFKNAGSSYLDLMTCEVVFRIRRQAKAMKECRLRGGAKVHLMAWIYILLADIFEVAWPFVLKRSVDLPKWITALSAVVFALPIFLLLSESVKHLPASTVYASFVGIGTLGTAIVGIVFFGESANLGRLGSFMLVVVGLVGLKLFSE